MTGSSNAKGPKFSIVIPTRDRPEHVRNALTSAMLQTYPDFEVIVCDNAKAKPCRDIVESFADRRFRYIAPSSPLSMCDNWDFAVAQARGDFVLVLIDKTMLRPSTLTHLARAIASHPAEIYSWSSDAFYLSNEAESVENGYLVPVRGAGEPYYVDCKPELSRRLSFAERLGTEGPNYCYGKICFGAYSKDLIARIKARFGRLFQPIAPDYTSMTKALLTADRLVDVNRSLLISTVTTISNGRLFTEDAVSGRRFLGETGFDESSFATMPVPGVFCALHNLVAFDYRLAWQSQPGQQPFGALDLANLCAEVDRDLDVIQTWASADEKREIGQNLYDFVATLPASDVRRFVSAGKCRLDAALAAVKAREAAVKGREDYVLFREDTALVRENNALLRETAVTRREEELVVRERLFSSQANSTTGRLFSRVSALERKARRVLGATPDEPAVPAAAPAATALPAAAPAAKPYAYPSFSSVAEALRFTDSDGYTYPLPTLSREAAADGSPQAAADAK